MASLSNLRWQGPVLLIAALSIASDVPAPGGESRMAGQAAVLSNARVSVDFGPRGMIALTDRRSGKRHEFPSEAFSLTLDGHAYPSRDLPEPARSVTSDRVRYAWNAGEYRLAVDYELGPDWHFVSKRLTVTAAPTGSFTVDAITLFDARLSEIPAEVFVPAYGRPNLQTGEYGAAVRFVDGNGLLVVAQNPFLHVDSREASLSLGYEPAMEWLSAWGLFTSDRGLLAPYVSSGRRLPLQMLPEWRMGDRAETDGMDEAEVAAYQDMVRAFLISPPERPIDVFVGWTANDYQIDVATGEGRAEYRRLLDRAAGLGAEYVLYAPSNSALSRREDSVDDWSWEHVLWLGLGQKIRRGEWDPAVDPVPPSVQTMLDYARSKDLKLLAYVYPVLPFVQNPEWLVSRPDDADHEYASLGVRSLQDWLIETLVAFHEKTGIGGYAFDHTFLGYEGTSRYAQWYGWRRVMEEVRRRIPDVVIDGRQAYHLYGPWTWLAGSYPHPTYSDEQPESFVPFPDLHFDRVSANRQRYTAFRYRNHDFAPSEIMPGFIGHQTSRSDETGRMPSVQSGDRGEVLMRFRARDWDYLGWRYSLLSSIATAGWNNVLNMIPARDLDEFRLFSPADATWLRRWLDWADENREYLRHTRTILGQPALGEIDGTSAMLDDGGFVFLFNPNGRVLETEIALDSTIGLDGAGPWMVREVFPVGGRSVGKPGAGFWTAGDRVTVELDGGSANVFEVRPAPASRADGVLFGVAGSLRFREATVHIENVRDEPGVAREVLVLLPPGREVSAVRVNGREVAFTRPSPGVLSTRVHFDGTRFRQYQQVGAYDPAFTGGAWSGSLSVPERIFEQLAARERAWRIAWTPEDYSTTWLAPERLLLFVQIAEPHDSMEVRMRIDGQPVEITKAYSAVRPVPRTFVGFYADVSWLDADREYRVELDLPPLRAGQFQGLFFENIEPVYTARLTNGGVQGRSF